MKFLNSLQLFVEETVRLFPCVVIHKEVNLTASLLMNNFVTFGSVLPFMEHVAGTKFKLRQYLQKKKHILVNERNFKNNYNCNFFFINSINISHKRSFISIMIYKWLLLFKSNKSSQMSFISCRCHLCISIFFFFFFHISPSPHVPRRPVVWRRVNCIAGDNDLQTTQPPEDALWQLGRTKGGEGAALEHAGVWLCIHECQAGLLQSRVVAETMAERMHNTCSGLFTNRRQWRLRCLLNVLSLCA